MKKTTLLLAFLLPFVVLNSCNKNDDDATPVPIPETVLVGQDGNPRFNLQFTNPENVDLDLYVKTPAGNTIYYANALADGGTLDVDCLCDNCDLGPNENIFWENGTAANGNYTYWVTYYGDCGGAGSKTASFTLRVIKNGTILETKTGELSAVGESQHYTFAHVN